METSKPVESVYSSMSSFVTFVTNILVPSVLKAKPVGILPCTLLLSTNVAAAALSRPVRIAETTKLALASASESL